MPLCASATPSEMPICVAVPRLRPGRPVGAVEGPELWRPAVAGARGQHPVVGFDELADRLDELRRRDTTRGVGDLGGQPPGCASASVAALRQHTFATASLRRCPRRDCDMLQQLPAAPSTCRRPPARPARTSCRSPPTTTRSRCRRSRCRPASPPGAEPRPPPRSRLVSRVVCSPTSLTSSSTTRSASPSDAVPVWFSGWQVGKLARSRVDNAGADGLREIDQHVPHRGGHGRPNRPRTSGGRPPGPRRRSAPGTRIHAEPGRRLRTGSGGHVRRDPAPAAPSRPRCTPARPARRSRCPAPAPATRASAGFDAG